MNVPVCFRRTTSLYALGSVTLSEGRKDRRRTDYRNNSLLKKEICSASTYVQTDTSIVSRESNSFGARTEYIGTVPTY